MLGLTGLACGMAGGFSPRGKGKALEIVGSPSRRKPVLTLHQHGATPSQLKFLFLHIPIWFQQSKAESIAAINILTIRDPFSKP